MKIINTSIPLEEIKQTAKSTFGNMIKAVVDIEKGIMAIDAEFHADLEGLLLINNSNNANLWGINLYPELKNDDWIEFDSMINLRPAQNNRSRGVENPGIRTKIITIVSKLVQR